MWHEQALQPGTTTALDAATLEAIAGDVPSASLDKGQVVGQPLVQIMLASGLQSSKAASKRMIKVSGQTCMAAVIAHNAATGCKACTHNQYASLFNLSRSLSFNCRLAACVAVTNAQGECGRSFCDMQGGGVQVNNVRITSEDHELSLEDLIEGRLLLLAAGKKNKLLVRVS